MRLEFILAQLLVDVFQPERLDLIFVHAPIDGISFAIKAARTFRLQTRVVGAKLGCFEEETERRSFGNVYAFWAW